MLGHAARDPDPGAGVITVTAPSMGASRQSRDPAPGRRDSSTTGQEIMNDSGSIPRERGVAGGRAAHASPDGAPGDAAAAPPPFQDRKSTRLNSSHVAISYAVFCLKKKTHT